MFHPNDYVCYVHTAVRDGSVRFEVRFDGPDHAAVPAVRRAGFRYGVDTGRYVGSMKEFSDSWIGSLEHVVELVATVDTRMRPDIRIDLTFETKAALRSAWPSLPDETKAAMRRNAGRVLVERSDERRVQDIKDRVAEILQSEREYEERRAEERRLAAEARALMATRRAEMIALYGECGQAKGSALVALRGLVRDHIDAIEGDTERKVAEHLAGKYESDKLTKVEDAWCWYLAIRHQDVVLRWDRSGAISAFWYGVKKHNARRRAA